MTGPMLAQEMGLSRRLMPVPAFPMPGLLIGGAIGLMLVAVLGLIGAGLVQEHVTPTQRLLAPGTLGHPLGTDQLGRDVLARTLGGFRWSLAVVVPATAIAAFVGTLLGLAAAANRGWTRTILESVTESAAAFPFFVLAAPIIGLAGRGYWPLLIVLGIVSSAPFALAVFEPTWRGRYPLGLTQALPAVWRALPAVGAFILADLVVAEVCLSFLGAGAPASAPSWGNMLADARQSVAVAPWMLYVPATALLLTVVSANWFGEGLGQLWGPGPG
jgi:ABC-type dipeptide/oligopeptide/nickel transport system permease subunit